VRTKVNLTRTRQDKTKIPLHTLFSFLFFLSRLRQARGMVVGLLEFSGNREDMKLRARRLSDIEGVVIQGVCTAHRS